MAAPAIKAISGSWNQTKVTPPMTTKKAMPFNKPTASSRQMVASTLVAFSSLVAMARTATVRVWVPALPPMEAAIGLSTASAANFSIEP